MPRKKPYKSAWTELKEQIERVMPLLSVEESRKMSRLLEVDWYIQQGIAINHRDRERGAPDRPGLNDVIHELFRYEDIAMREASPRDVEEWDELVMRRKVKAE